MPTNFPPRKLRPLSPEQYRRIVRDVRELLERIEIGCEPETHAGRMIARASARTATSRVRKRLPAVGAKYTVACLDMMAVI